MPKLTIPDRGVLRSVALPLALSLTLVLGGCGGRGSPPPTAADPAPAPTAPAPTVRASAPTVRAPAPPPSGSRPLALDGAPAYAALAASDLAARPAPGSRTAVSLFPARILPWNTPTPFLVRRAHRDQAGVTWYQVLLPRRPNGSVGWVRGDLVRLVPLSHRLEVDLSDRRVTLFEGDRPARVFPAAIGKPATPTPTGQFFITVKLRPPAIRATAYGPWALGLSAYSEVLEQFGTGDGQIALHGHLRPRHEGGAVSNGCVRLYDGAITLLANLLPPGTPVTIRA